MKPHTLTFQSEIDYSAIQPINDLLSKVKIRILYAGLNRNNSYLKKEVVENAIKSLPYIPIVGEFDESIDNFLGHGGRVIIDSSGNVKIEDSTKAYGVVPFFNDSKPRWEILEDSETGRPTEYLVADAYLWTGRYDELNVVIDNGSYQSMEILIKDADWTKSINSTGKSFDYYEIKEFVFTALCILGKDDENEENSTIPCFEDSQIEAYKNNSTLTNELEKMVAELKSFDLERSDFTLDSKNNAIVNKVEEIQEEIINETEFEIDEKVNENVGENTEPLIEKMQIEEPIPEEVYELSHDEIRESLHTLLVSKYNNAISDEYGIWITSVYSDYFVYEIYPNQFFKQDYVMDSTNVEFIGEPMEVYAQYLSESEVNEIDNVRNQNGTLMMEVEELKTYKQTRELEDKQVCINEIFEKFNMLNDEDIAEIKSNALNMELVDLEKELAYLAINKKIFSKTNKSDNSKTLTMKVTDKQNNNDLALRYGSASKYFKD